MQTLVAPAITDRAIEIRREIHRHPELGFEEVRTAALVESELDELGIEHRRVATTGVVGVIRGSGDGPVAGLPLDERSGETFSSEVSGKMHACGHDAHTAMLLGAARVLQSHRDSLGGDVVLLFQPAEEGPGGALPMIEAGALDDPKVDAVAMLHVDTRLATGTLGITGGAVNAAADEFHVTIEGKGGHGASPHTAVDAIPCAAATVLALQNLAARETDPLATSVGMSGTFRTQDRALRATLEGRARRIVEGVAAAYGARGNLTVIYGYPPVVNDDALAAGFAAYAATNTSSTIAEPPPTMGGEDFAYFAERVPGVMARLGIRSEHAGSVFPGHSAEFRIDEDAIAYGIEALVAFARGVGSGAIAGSAKP